MRRLARCAIVCRSTQSLRVCSQITGYDAALTGSGVLQKPRTKREKDKVEPQVLEVGSRLVKLPLAAVKPADWNYKQEATQAELKKLKASIIRDRSAGVLAVRQLKDGDYEVIDGNHRLAALQSLGVAEYVFENFGPISQAEAVTVARRRNHIWFEEDLMQLSKLMRDVVIPEVNVDTLSSFMPDTLEELKNMVSLAEFDWSSLPDAPASKTTSKLHFLATEDCMLLYRKWQKLAYKHFKLRDNTDVLVKALSLAIASVGSSEGE